MRNTTPENDSSRNGLVIQPATKPQTVREYLASSSNAAFNEQVKAACAKRGLDLDSPWPMKLGGGSSDGASAGIRECRPPR